MSLWAADLEALTFEQLDDFLKLSTPEGMRLEYKIDCPKQLAKMIAASANTLGGLIVLGVDEDANTTQPISPPDTTNVNAMKYEPGSPSESRRSRGRPSTRPSAPASVP